MDETEGKDQSWNTKSQQESNEREECRGEAAQITDRRAKSMLDFLQRGRQVGASVLAHATMSGFVQILIPVLIEKVIVIGAAVIATDIAVKTTVAVAEEIGRNHAKKPPKESTENDSGVELTKAGQKLLEDMGLLDWSEKTAREALKAKGGGGFYCEQKGKK